MLQLTRPLVFVDAETTGLDRETDRIVQISLHKVASLDHLPVTAGPHTTHLAMYIDPQREIPAASIAIHGITAEVLRANNAKPFHQVARQLFDFLMGCDVAGFGSNFYDVPLLYNEFARCGIYWGPGSFQMIDVGNLFKIKHPRSLSAAVRKYLGREHDGAHSATIDSLATSEVFVEQLRRYPDLPETIEELAIYTNYGRKVADISGKFYYDNDGVVRYGFGKYKDQPALDYPDFLEWMLHRANFPADTNKIVADLLNYPYGQQEDEGEYYLD
ncbi:3'-5' exonuclease [Fibrella forsythiae]|uniref:3'-5' exonuclease n=1 Tax=Fibrella forsythiae TaxID=2817061 RepID=A0ABS3JBI1_9BACT|nr:3'-5' exonuclease [Fibrella forsythiae]MBO0947347.1 3'-5' exonuclease [Fibrella forsythiae]